MKLLRVATTIALAACVLPALPARADEATGTQVLFSKGTDGYECFRIPALIRAADNSLLAFAEARKPLAGGSWCADAAPIDTVVRRSTDDGRTWSAPSIVLSGSPDGSSAGATRGNPVPILISHGPHSGRIVLLTTYNPAGGGERTPFEQYSDDNGRTWSAARNIESEIDDPSFGWYATGPGHGIQLQHGPHAGRLVAGVNYDDANGPTHGAIVYSDDAGAHWHRGADAIAPVQNHQFGEVTVFQAQNGDVIATARNKIAGDMTQSRMSAISTDGGSTFTSAGFQANTDLACTPGVEGSSLLLNGHGPNGLALFSTPVDPALRKNMTIFASTDSGRSWSSVKQLTTDRSGYSDLTDVGRGDIGVLYEAGDYPAGDARDEIRFQLVPVRQLVP